MLRVHQYVKYTNENFCVARYDVISPASGLCSSSESWQIDALEEDNFAFCLWLFDEDVDGYECSRLSNARTVQRIIMTLLHNDGVT